MAELLGDQGLGHSPVYGFAKDGFPIYGPWQSKGVLATSCWKTRDYTGLNTAEGGWGCKTSSSDTSSSGKRKCTLDDQFNPTETVTISSSSNYGPDITASVNSQSGNPFTMISGSYFEDFYYDSSCTSESTAALDQYNGHSHDDLGWHYHLTVNSAGLPQFPFGIGPQFYGMLPEEYEDSCCSSVVNAQSPTCSSTDSTKSNYDNQVDGTTLADNSVPSYSTASYSNYLSHTNPFCYSSTTTGYVELQGFTSETLDEYQEAALISAFADVTGLDEVEVTGLTILTTSTVTTSMLHIDASTSEESESSDVESTNNLRGDATTTDHRNFSPMEESETVSKRRLDTTYNMVISISASPNLAFDSLHDGTAAAATTISSLVSAVSTAFSNSIGSGVTTFTDAIASACSSIDNCDLPTLTSEERKPSAKPTQSPTKKPSAKPTVKPSAKTPTAKPSKKPTAKPSKKPTKKLTKKI